MRHNATKKRSSFADFFINVIKSFNTRCAYQYRYNGAWHSLSFKQLKQKVDSVVAYLESLAIKADTHVAIMSESRIEWTIFLFAAWLRGLIVVPIDEKLTETQLLTVLASIQPSLCAISPSCFKRHIHIFKNRVNIFILDMHNNDAHNITLSNLPPIDSFSYRKADAHTTILIAFTSSTSGASKGVMLSWENLYHQIDSLGDYFDVGAEHIFLSVLPLSHMLELTCGLLTVFSKGAQTCYLGSLLPDEILKVSKKINVTHMIAVPMLLDMLQKRMQHHQNNGTDLNSTLATLIVGGAQINTESINYFSKHNIKLLQGYGLTEASPVVTLNTTPFKKPLSIGRPLPSVRIQFSTSDPQRKQGEILVQGPNVMSGYYQDKKLTQSTLKNGWLHTGDLGYQDEDGFIYITGRLKNMIILPSGKNVSSEEVELCIQGCHLVKEVAVIGIRLPHIYYNQEVEQICAVVIISKTENRVKIKKTIEDQCKQLNAYKRPQHIFFDYQELPKTSTGKIQKQLVQAIAKKLYSIQDKGNN